MSLKSATMESLADKIEAQADAAKAELIALADAKKRAVKEKTPKKGD